MSADEVTPEDRKVAAARLAGAAMVLREAVLEARRCGMGTSELRRIVDAGAKRKRAEQ